MVKNLNQLFFLLENRKLFLLINIDQTIFQKKFNKKKNMFKEQLNGFQSNLHMR